MSTPVSPNAQGKRALVVDDVEEVGEVVSRVLQQLGYEVDTALDGQQAMEMSRCQSYDAVVCDLLMPRTSGQALFEMWKSENPDLAEKVIFVTGDSSSEETRRFLAVSGRPCMYKPFRLGQLAELVTMVTAT